MEIDREYYDEMWPILKKSYEKRNDLWLSMEFGISCNAAESGLRMKDEGYYNYWVVRRDVAEAVILERQRSKEPDICEIIENESNG